MNEVLETAVETVANTPKDPSTWLVCLLGLGTVFVGLIALILLCTVIGLIFRKLGEKKATAAEETAAPAPAAATTANIPNRQETVAAISAALAEEMGTDVAGLRIISIRPYTK